MVGGFFHLGGGGLGVLVSSLVVFCAYVARCPVVGNLHAVSCSFRFCCISPFSSADSNLQRAMLAEGLGYHLPLIRSGMPTAFRVWWYFPRFVPYLLSFLRRFNRLINPQSPSDSGDLCTKETSPDWVGRKRKLANMGVSENRGP